LAQCADPCESTCFSIYIDVDGFVMPCSFSSGMNVPRIDMNKDDDFLKDVWFNPKMNEWRDSLLKNCRSCPLYDLEMR
jgi:radical SAM protein with 4Fe4S-binding SPASM domain